MSTDVRPELRSFRPESLPDRPSRSENRGGIRPSVRLLRTSPLRRVASVRVPSLGCSEEPPRESGPTVSCSEEPHSVGVSPSAARRSNVVRDVPAGSAAPRSRITVGGVERNRRGLCRVRLSRSPADRFTNQRICFSQPDRFSDLGSTSVSSRLPGSRLPFRPRITSRWLSGTHHCTGPNQRSRGFSKSPGLSTGFL